jgi:hypothetical protein
VFHDVWLQLEQARVIGPRLPYFLSVLGFRAYSPSRGICQHI